ncbi:MarR family winged helix-turn-helix transcriptional regulator [Actinokineospora inagensis]|uniref:MarR family winged helix-turn-helix transcriptional regulator n=1 Tax=Actinokineospora inagensis TaxID=103730 RepID=UPI0003F859EB|nr:MarR family winged helix-turn-helix transcriptional regulator [Actinokineospora inagensis]
MTPVPFLLAIAYRAMTEDFHARLAELDREPLRPAHGYTFRYLAENPEATTVGLAEFLGVTKQAASKAVAELHNWGYVERKPHPTDRRAHIVALTERGWEYLGVADRLWGEVERGLADVIGAGQVAAMADSLGAYIDHVSGGRSAPPRPVW